ncbi:uncharacterized protein TNCV_2395691 [Trichonephila clavipes]|nr:uncharacterized protein TNCV_2395691 [Trichonephila clavipes]
MLKDDEIVTFVQVESDPVGDETDEVEDNNKESSKGTLNAGAFSALDTSLEWHEQPSERCPTQLLLFRSIRDLAAKRCTMDVRRHRQTQLRQTFVLQEPMVFGTKTEEAECRFVTLANQELLGRERGPSKELKELVRKVT